MKLLVRGILDRLFIVGLVAFLALGSIVVLVQLGSVIMGNGTWTVEIAKILGNMTCYVATVTGLIGYVQGYLYGWKSGD
jgi:hypothetical protein